MPQYEKKKALTVTQEYPSYYRSKPKTMQRYLKEPASLSIEESKELFKAYISIPNLKSTASCFSALRTGDHEGSNDTAIQHKQR